MPVVSAGKAFREYYSDLLKHPKKASYDQKVDVVIRTFEALNGRAENVQLGERSIRVSDLKGDDLKVFAKFSSLFLTMAEMPEKEAVALAENMEGVEKKIEGNELEKNLLEEIKKAKSRVLIHMQLAKDEKASGNAPIDRAKICLDECLKEEQEQASKVERKLSSKKRGGVAPIAFIMGMGGLGIGVMVGGIVLSVLFLPGLAGFAACILAFLMGGILLSPLFDQVGEEENKKASIAELQKELDSSVAKLIKFERFKQNVIQRKEFIDFVQDESNGFEKSSKDLASFEKFLLLYERRSRKGDGKTKSHGE